MKTLKPALLAGTIAFVSTMAFAQTSTDPTKTPHNAATDKGTAAPTATEAKPGMKSPGANPAMAKDADKTPHNAATDQGAAKPATTDSKSSVKSSPGADPATTGAEISGTNKTGNRPSEDTVSPADKNKTR